MAYNEQIGSESRYEAAIRRNIMNNAKKTKSKNFLAVAEQKEISDWLLGEGQYRDVQTPYTDAEIIRHFGADVDVNEMRESCDQHYITKYDTHPLRNNMFNGDFGGFLLDLARNLREYGALTPKQTEIASNALARAKKWLTEREIRAEEFRAKAQKSEFIGSVKDRLDFELKVNKVLAFEGKWGYTYINLCQQGEDLVVYKGSKSFQEGSTIKVKATVKDHETRDGVKQTIIARPKEL